VVYSHSLTRLLEIANVITPMSPNKQVIEKYMASTDRSEVAPLLTDDVEWVEWADGVPASGVITRGKPAFIQNFGDDELRSEINRMTEENDVVVAEGTARVHKKDGSILTVKFCDIFEMEMGKVKKLSSFGALIKDSS
jgi:ketosteroid isomerase-like protein